MRDNKFFIDKAIEQLQGKAEIGSVIAHRSNKLAHTLIDIINGIAHCQLPDGTINQFPYSEIFDCNDVKDLAIMLKVEDILIPDRLN